MIERKVLKADAHPISPGSVWGSNVSGLTVDREGLGLRVQGLGFRV